MKLPEGNQMATDGLMANSHFYHSSLSARIVMPLGKMVTINHC